MSEALLSGELLAAVDEEKPNQYPASRKLSWLRELDGLVQKELLETHAGEIAALPESYDELSSLLVPEPYGAALYRFWLFAQIDLTNGEILKYNQSLALFNAAWRLYADSLNRASRPVGAGGWRF